MKKNTKHLLALAAVAVVGVIAYKQYQKNKAAKALAAKPAKPAAPATDASSSSFIGPTQLVINKSNMSNASVKQMKNAQWNGSGAKFNKPVFS